MVAARKRQSEVRALALAGGAAVAVRWVRDPSARRLRLSVSELGVRLTVPWRMAQQHAEAFLADHQEWLRQKLHEFARRAPAATLQRGVSRELPLRGGVIALDWVDASYAGFVVQDDRLQLRLPSHAPADAACRLLRDFYAAQARADIGRWLPGYLPGLPRAPRLFRIRPLSSRWGSLNSADIVSLDLALVLAPPAAFEYVLVHELCHILQPNHSPAFWREVQRRCPDWRRQREWLRREGMAVKAQLRGLLQAP